MKRSRKIAVQTRVIFLRVLRTNICKEGLRTLAKSLVQMTCSDFTNFLKLTEFSAEQPNQRLDLTNFLKSCEIKRIISAVLMAMRQKKQIK